MDLRSGGDDIDRFESYAKAPDLVCFLELCCVANPGNALDVIAVEGLAIVLEDYPAGL